MKQLLFILLLTFVLSEVISSSSTGTEKITYVNIEIIKPKAIILVKTVGMPFSLIDDSILLHQLHIESGSKQNIKDSSGNITIITSSRGAVGIAQFLPSTWNWLKEHKILPSYFTIDNENHQRAAQRFYMNYLARQDYGIDYNKTRLALASYNTGSGRVINLIKKYGMDWEAHLPVKTQEYLKLLIG